LYIGTEAYENKIAPLQQNCFKEIPGHIYIKKKQFISFDEKQLFLP